MVKLIFGFFRWKMTLNFCELWALTILDFNSRAKNCVKNPNLNKTEKSKLINIIIHNQSVTLPLNLFFQLFLLRLSFPLFSSSHGFLSSNFRSLSLSPLFIFIFIKVYSITTIPLIYLYLFEASTSIIAFFLFIFQNITVTLKKFYHSEDGEMTGLKAFRSKIHALLEIFLVIR